MNQSIATFLLHDLKDKRRDFAAINEILRPDQEDGLDVEEQDACLALLTRLEEDVKVRQCHLANLIMSGFYPGN